MAELVLNARPRKITGKQVKALRRQGWIPAVLYGRHIQPRTIQVEGKEFQRVMALARGGTRLITLQVDGETHLALIREVQREPIRREILHVDFQAVELTEKIRVEVPVVFVGASPAVERGEGILVHGLTHVEIECLPKDLIEAITVDLGRLDRVDAAIYVRDLQVPPGITVVSDPDELIVLVTAPAAEVLEEAALPAEMPEVEVIGRGKKVEEEEEEEG
ncbi:50S ribosomal protein L25 [Thermoflexus sp.]|uniref:50S ribosomal protein L25 n=1 Tax=Thermoflexus sp. TaxID=1969742 RepID=UPI0025EF880E|nr:50S ribosomal protein L25 [Thermoflexus sp.]MDW8179678.1 50S ribosomal protein L25 [Anaerolineae bacterium]MCS6963942.1 50S ribosomal protein L25 [Thermoflexus sp.]MCS7350227.1 50S ribosomal protein L25 [Thermoflexus sp.]MCX7691498.1 50S ribosomal protein L25 [Thermoflexus sp.]MDW8184339.1 50S ribosomal protein L25 [Anaerolineae bacterium]